MPPRTKTPDPADETADPTVEPDPAPEDTTIEGPEPGQETELSEEARAKILRDAYSEAQRWLREKYKTEFNAKRQEIAAANGVEWEPPLSATERAMQQIRAMIEADPSLAERIGFKDEPTEEEAGE